MPASDNVYIYAFSSSGVCGSSVKTCRREYAVSWCVCVKGRWPMGGTVQVNTSCQSVRFSRRPRPPLPVGINLTLLIHPHTHTGPEPGTAPTRSYLSPSKSLLWNSSLSTHSTGTSPRFRLGLCTRRFCIHWKRLQRKCDDTKVFLKSSLWRLNPCQTTPLPCIVHQWMHAIIAHPTKGWYHL